MHGYYADKVLMAFFGYAYNNLAFLIQLSVFVLNCKITSERERASIFIYYCLVSLQFNLFWHGEIARLRIKQNKDQNGYNDSA